MQDHYICWCFCDLGGGRRKDINLNVHNLLTRKKDNNGLMLDYLDIFIAKQ